MELYHLEEWARARHTETLLALRRAQLLGLTRAPGRPRRRGLARFFSSTRSSATAGPPAITREAS